MSLSLREAYGMGIISQLGFSRWLAHRDCVGRGESGPFPPTEHRLVRCVRLLGPHRKGWLFRAFTVLSPKDELTHLPTETPTGYHTHTWG